MESYFDVLKGYLTNGAYTLTDATTRIDYGVAAGKITPDQAKELLTLAQSKAGGVDVELQISALAMRVTALENQTATESGGGSKPVDNILTWHMPIPGVDSYIMAGDKFRYDGKVYASNINYNTTVPGSDTRWWTLIE